MWRLFSWNISKKGVWAAQQRSLSSQRFTLRPCFFLRGEFRFKKEEQKQLEGPVLGNSQPLCSQAVFIRIQSIFQLNWWWKRILILKVFSVFVILSVSFMPSLNPLSSSRHVFLYISHLPPSLVSACLVTSCTSSRLLTFSFCPSQHLEFSPLLNFSRDYWSGVFIDRQTG